MLACHIYACFDKQLYDVTIQVAGTSLVVHPARMYIIVIFACIGTIMNCSALEFYVIAVYG